MLDLGFLEDVEKILKRDAQRPPDRAVQRDDAAADPQARRPLPLRPGSHQGEVADAHRRHRRAVPRSRSSPTTRPTSSSRCSRAEQPDQAIVFARTKIRADQLYRKLRDKGMNVKALHGDMTQGQRDGVMLSFKGGRVPILVATDVAARGLDISTVTHVVNFDVPVSPDVYVHRIGRTGRVGRSGRAITFVEPRQTARARGDREAHRPGRSRRGSAGAHVDAGARSRSARAATPSRTLSRNGDEPYAQADRRRRARRRRRGRRPRPRRDARGGRRRRGRPRRAGCSSASALLSVPAAEADRSWTPCGRCAWPPARLSARLGRLRLVVNRGYARSRSAGCRTAVRRTRPQSPSARRPGLRAVRRRDGARPGLVPGVRHGRARPPRPPARHARAPPRSSALTLRARRRRGRRQLRGAQRRRRAATTAKRRRRVRRADRPGAAEHAAPRRRRRRPRPPRRRRRCPASSRRRPRRPRRPLRTRADARAGAERAGHEHADDEHAHARPRRRSPRRRRSSRSTSAPTPPRCTTRTRASTASSDPADTYDGDTTTVLHGHDRAAATARWRSASSSTSARRARSRS